MNENNREKARQVLLMGAFLVAFACAASLFAYFMYPPGDTRLSYFCLSGLLAALGVYLVVRKKT